MSCCLKYYIGIRLCSDSPDSDSGLYINSLPGLSIESIDNVATSEQSSYLGLWSDAQDEAWATFEIDFYNELLKCHDVDRNCDWKQLICRNKKVLANAWRFLLGNQLMLFRLYSTRLNIFTLDDKEAGELRDLYQVKYEEALTKSVQLLDMSSVPLHCAPKLIDKVAWLP